MICRSKAGQCNDDIWLYYIALRFLVQSDFDVNVYELYWIIDAYIYKLWALYHNFNYL